VAENRFREESEIVREERERERERERESFSAIAEGTLDLGDIMQLGSLARSLARLLSMYRVNACPIWYLDILTRLPAHATYTLVNSRNRNMTGI
jgi:hypothetical protein